MSVRSLNGLSTGSVRSLNGLNVNTITADLPVLINNRNITLKGLNGFTANKIIKVNSAGNALEYVDETDTLYSVASPLELSSGNQISLNQALLGNTTIVRVQCDRFNNSNTNAIMLYASGTDILTIGNNAIANLKFNQKNTSNGPQSFTLPSTGSGGELQLSISTTTPLSKTGNTIELDFSGLTDYGEENTITNATEFVVSTDGAKVLRALTYSKLLNQIDTYVNTNLDVIASAPLVITTINTTKSAFSYDMNTMTAIPDAQVGDTMLLHAGTLDAPNYLNRKMTGFQLKSYIAHQGTNFGTTATADIVMGSNSHRTSLFGEFIILDNQVNGEIVCRGANNSVSIYLQEDSGSIVRGNGLNIAGYFQNTAKIVLGNVTNNTEVFGNDVAITGGLATGSSSGGFTRRLNIYNRGLYLYQSPWGGAGSSSVGRASWLITPGFQQFRLEFHLTATNGALIFMSYINGVGVYVVEYSFTGQHKSKSINDTIYNNIEDYVGLICYATGEYATYDFDNETCNSDSEGITINDSMPIIDLCNTKKDKRVYGVISNKEDTDREMGYGRFVSKLPSANDANRVVVNGIGEGAIWIVNTNGNLENGDYIQTSNVAGYGEKQDDDLLHNYTVAKITCDCDFNMLSNKYRSKMVGDNIACFVGVIYYCG